LTPAERRETRKVLSLRKAGLPDDLKQWEDETPRAPKPWLRARALTHMRREIVKTVDAQICVGGRTTGAAGRMPGVVEEAYLLTQAKKPVYFSGLVGGAAKLIIDNLGAKSPDARLFVTKPEVEQAYGAAKSKDPDARIDRVAWSKHFRSLTMTKVHTANKLTKDENRQLCDAGTTDEMLALILRGLRRVHDAKK
jgi:hypothetical protein